MSGAPLIAIAMSGGVDSSVAAALLAQRGEQVFGLMLRLWSAGGRYPNRCCSPRDVENARRVAERLGIPFYVLDAQEPFREAVVDRFVDGYRRGVTPNPCLACNRDIRWGLLLNRALALGATHLATGHYARIVRGNGRFHLLRARDRQKDQSYVLSVLDQVDLAQSIFPLGELSKPEVRSRARQLELATADRAESQDLCFLGGLDYREFLDSYGGLEPVPGKIVDLSGELLGEHKGLANYTIGQRKGIGISGPEPLYVVEKDPETNRLTVGPRSALFRYHLRVDGLHWVSGEAPQAEQKLTVQIRYRASPQPCTLTTTTSPGWADVHLHEPIAAVTPGQAAVFYQGDECLGGGVIAQ